MLFNVKKSNIKKIWFLFCVWVCLIIAWCDASLNNNSFSFHVSDFLLTYNGNVKLEELGLKADDNDDIIALYQEAWDNIGYKDSLLIAEKYSQWLWVNAFAQSNIDTLYDYNLSIENITKTQLNIEDKKGKRNAVLVEYDITSWFVESIPALYMSQLFIENDTNIILMSYSTESTQSREYASNMFKNIK